MIPHSSTRAPAPILLSPALALLLAACASAGGGGEGVLSIVPAAGTTHYEREQTLELSIDAGGQLIPVNVAERSSMEMTRQRQGGNTRVTLAIRSYEGRTTNPMAPAVTGTVEQIQGPVIFDLDSRGRATPVSLPGVTGGASEMFNASQLVHELIPRLPGGPVAPGGSWTDTISYQSEGVGGGSDAVHLVVRYTAVGDTVVSGRSYLLIRAESQDRVQQQGSSGGMQFSQSLDGTSRHTYLWDLAEGVLHASRVEGNLRGSMTVDVAPMPLTVTARVTAATTRR